METSNEIKATGEELYGNYLDGDATAFGELIELYEDELSRFIYGITRDYHDTKHLAAETFAQLIINKKKFAGKSSLKTYLFAIAKNLSSKHIKEQLREQHISFDDVVEVLTSGEEVPYNFLEKEEVKNLLHETMQDLKDEYRTVLTLIYFEDMNYRNAGIAMSKSEKQIKKLVYDAKIALKKRLEKDKSTFFNSD